MTSTDMKNTARNYSASGYTRAARVIRRIANAMEGGEISRPEALRLFGEVTYHVHNHEADW